MLGTSGAPPERGKRQHRDRPGGGSLGPTRYREAGAIVCWTGTKARPARELGEPAFLRFSSRAARPAVGFFILSLQQGCKDTDGLFSLPCSRVAKAAGVCVWGGHLPEL